MQAKTRPVAAGSPRRPNETFPGFRGALDRKGEFDSVDWRYEIVGELFGPVDRFLPLLGKPQMTIRCELILSLSVASLLIAGCGEGSPKAANAPTSTTKASTADATASSTADPSSSAKFNDLIVGLNLPDLPERFAEVRDEWQNDQDNARKTMRFIDFVARIGQLHEEQGTEKQAAVAFRAAEQLLKDARTNGLKIEPTLERILTFHLACVAAKENDIAQSMTLLNKAVDLGYSDLAKIRDTEALEKVRALPEFSESMPKWEKARHDFLVATGRARLTSENLFPFSFELTDVQDNPVKLSDFQGKVCIVDFWGTWCPPCIQEIPSFIRLQDEFGPQGFQMIGLNFERTDPKVAKVKVQEFVDTNGINYPCALLNDEVLGKVPELEGFPTTLFIDRAGKVRAKLVGQQPHETLEAILMALLEEPVSDEAKK